MITPYKRALNTYIKKTERALSKQERIEHRVAEEGMWSWRKNLKGVS